MNIGTLIEYYSMDDEIVYGVVTEYIEHCEELSRRPAVQVCWMDDSDFTLESIENLRDPDVDYIKVTSSI